LACVGSGQQSLNRFRLRGPLSHQVLGALLEEPMRSTLASRRLAPSFILATTIKWDITINITRSSAVKTCDCAKQMKKDAVEFHLQ